MNADIANIFVRAAVYVFEKEVGVTMKRHSLVKKNTPIPGLPISIILGVTGSLRGQVVYSMGRDSATDITRSMVSTHLPSRIAQLVNSAVGEIANMITGRATIELAGRNEALLLTPPAVFIGEDLWLDFLKAPTVSLRLESSIGVLEINIALKEVD